MGKDQTFAAHAAERSSPSSDDDLSWEIAESWCADKGAEWVIEGVAGRGGTAPVYSLTTPEGPRALKIYDANFSEGAEGEIQLRRVQKQVDLGDHECPYLVKVYDGGEFQGRLFVLMNRAPGSELTSRLTELPRTAIRRVVSQVTQAALFLEEHGLCHRDIKSENIFISDDFSVATLLDVSVLREINDPVGLGTDHGDKLPMIATARYSPPEYLFRLTPPTKESWHALNVYQLGALLFELIEQEGVFQQDFSANETNRYRFAWIVATQTPVLSKGDVDRDLISLARRALDKNWERRAEIPLESFLDTVQARQTSALSFIGLGQPEASEPETSEVRNRDLKAIARRIDAFLAESLREDRVTAKHSTDRFPGGWKAKLEWSTADGSSFEFEVRVTPSELSGEPAVLLAGTLTSTEADVTSHATRESSPLPIAGENTEIELEAKQLLAETAVRLMKPVGGGE